MEERGSFVSLAEAAEYPTVETGVAAGDDVFLFEVRERDQARFLDDFGLFLCLSKQLNIALAVFRIRIQLNQDPAKILNPDPEDLESGSGLFLYTI